MALGTQAVTSAVKVIAIANASLRSQGKGEICVVPSTQLRMSNRGESQGQIVKGVKLEVFAA
jgi:stage V sporulation protein SpoVS